MNIERLNEIKDWLKNGSPTMVLDMDTSIQIEHDNNDGTKECGTSCCIAGFASQRARPLHELISTGRDQGRYQTFASEQQFRNAMQEREEFYGDWDVVRDTALRYLGLPAVSEEEWVEYLDKNDLKDDANPNSRSWYSDGMGHPLFTPELAPDDCTPDQAIQAIDNCIAGKFNPWEGVQ